MCSCDDFFLLINMNFVTRRLVTRAKACKIIVPPVILLGLIFWATTPEGALKTKLTSWMQRQPLATGPKKEERFEARVGEETAVLVDEEPWLVDTTQVRLWIGRKRLIG